MMMFITKKKTYDDSHLELNKYFFPISSWRRAEIEAQSWGLVKAGSRAIWSYFGTRKTLHQLTWRKLRGTSPKRLKDFRTTIWSQDMAWCSGAKPSTQLLTLSLTSLITIAHNFPRYRGKDKKNFAAASATQNDYCIEVNLSAQQHSKDLPIKRWRRLNLLPKTGV